MLRSLQLPFQFDALRLQQEVAQIEQSYWLPHYNERVYSGHWSVIALMSPNGQAGHIYSVPANGTAAVITYTSVLQPHSYFREVLDQLTCTKTLVRLMKLDASASIAEHEDEGLNYEGGEVRLHIPVYTNEDVDFQLDGQRVRMHTGECWYLNLNLPHSVANRGTTNRIHLVIDCLVNDWLTDLFVRTDRTVSNSLASKNMVYGTD